jgi:hypothetical protein
MKIALLAFHIVLRSLKNSILSSEPFESYNPNILEDNIRNAPIL